MDKQDNFFERGNTSTKSTSKQNSGESLPQGGENLDVEEQNRPLAQEEYIRSDAQNSVDENSTSAGLTSDDSKQEDPVDRE